MPLSPPTARNEMHRRAYDFRGFQRADGLWDIEVTLSDTKSYPFTNNYRGEIQPGEALHGMSLRITIDEDFEVIDIEAAIDDSPFAICPAIAPNFKRMIGVRIGAGWRREIRSRVGGVQGCTHLVEMLGGLATVAYQTLYPVRAKNRKEEPRKDKPGLLNSCHAFDSAGGIVKETWPDFYTGD